MDNFGEILESATGSTSNAETSSPCLNASVVVKNQDGVSGDQLLFQAVSSAIGALGNCMSRFECQFFSSSYALSFQRVDVKPTSSSFHSAMKCGSLRMKAPHPFSSGGTRFEQYIFRVLWSCICSFPDSHQNECRATEKNERPPKTRCARNNKKKQTFLVLSCRCVKRDEVFCLLCSVVMLLATASLETLPCPLLFQWVHVASSMCSGFFFSLRVIKIAKQNNDP